MKRSGCVAMLVIAVTLAGWRDPAPDKAAAGPPDGTLASRLAAADRAAQAEDWNASLAIYTALAAAAPDNGEWAYRVARAAEKLGRAGEAVDGYARAIA